MTMTLKTVPVMGWGKRNLWPLPSGELAVRPGLLYTNFALQPDDVLSGFSVQKPTNEEVFHYIFSLKNDELRLEVFDEDFVVLQRLEMNTERRPRAITAALIGLDLVFMSPDMPPLWGIVGNGHVFAAKEESQNSLTPAIEIPRGICAAWAGRVVIGAGDTLYVSDAFDDTGRPRPRTYVGVNAYPMPGGIYGLHVGSDGGLFICATDGVYYFPEDVAGTGQVPDFDFAKASDHPTINYGTTTVAEGRVWGLTRRGIKLIDEANGRELNLNDPIGPRAFGGRIAREDWRNAQLYGGERGPIVSSEIHDASWFFDTDRDFASWWTTSEHSTMAIRGVLRRFSGEDMYLLPDGIVRAFGNYDGLVGSSEVSSNQPKGVVFGRLDIPPAASPNLREVHVGTDATSGNALTAVRSTEKSGAPAAAKRGLVIGTDDWGAGKTYEQPSLRSYRGQHVYRGDDPFVEAGAERCLARVSEAITVGFRGPSPRRPTD